MQHLKCGPVTSKFGRPSGSQHKQAATRTLLRKSQQHLPHRVIAAVSIVEEHDDRPGGTSLGQQTRHPLDQVVAKSVRARSSVVGAIGMAWQRWQIGKPASADAADSIRCCSFFWSMWRACRWAKSIDPGPDRWRRPHHATVCDQANGKLRVMRHQFGGQPGLSQTRVAEHQGHP
jgi:hypothetical protein